LYINFFLGFSGGKYYEKLEKNCQIDIYCLYNIRQFNVSYYDDWQRTFNWCQKSKI